MDKAEKAKSLINESKVVILATDRGVYIDGYKGRIIQELTALLRAMREDIGGETMDRIFEASRKTEEEIEAENKEMIFNMLQGIWKGE